MQGLRAVAALGETLGKAPRRFGHDDLPADIDGVHREALRILIACLDERIRRNAVA